MEKKKILFGAGLYGRMALQKYGKDNIAFFVDNNRSLWGKKCDDIDILSPAEILKYENVYEIIITTKFKERIVEQLINMGIENHKINFFVDRRLYPVDELIMNPYENTRGDFLDIEEQAISQKISSIEAEVNKLYHKNEIFNHIEIETVNRCNGSCSFCPVNRNNDTRQYAVMTDELFKSIIVQLAQMQYAGRVLLFSNNEPFLDDKIIERHRYVKEQLPSASLHLYTNGTLLTIDKFKEIIKYLDELIIDNYQQELQLIKPCREIVDYCRKYPDLKEKVTIVLRKPDEILSNRGGDSPNRKDKVSYPEAKCVLPYKQLIVRPDGKVSLCCSDPLGRNTLADLTKETILEAWNNQKFQTVRESLYNGRKNWGHCMYCDVFNIG